MDVRIVGVELPGRTCGDPRPGGLEYENVHVGVQRRKDVVDLVPGDAPGAEWNLTVDTVTKDGALDQRGPFVHGKRGDRFLRTCSETTGEDVGILDALSGALSVKRHHRMGGVA